MKVPAYSYQFQPASIPEAGIPTWSKALREELQGMSQTVDNILVRIERLAQK